MILDLEANVRLYRLPSLKAQPAFITLTTHQHVRVIIKLLFLLLVLFFFYLFLLFFLFIVFAVIFIDLILIKLKFDPPIVTSGGSVNIRKAHRDIFAAKNCRFLEYTAFMDL